MPVFSWEWTCGLWNRKDNEFECIRLHLLMYNVRISPYQQVKGRLLWFENRGKDNSELIHCTCLSYKKNAQLSYQSFLNLADEDTFYFDIYFVFFNSKTEDRKKHLNPFIDQGETR